MLFLGLLVSGLWVCASAMDYCAHMACEGGKKNTFCQYPTEALDDDCSEEDWIHRAESLVVLRAHNELRSRVAMGMEKGQPSAANMRELEWHNELQEIARRWARQCQPVSDECRRTSMFKVVGQNIASLPSKQGTRKKRLIQYVEQWFDGMSKLNQKDIAKFPGGDGSSKNYTQLMWADTWLVGCGRSTTKSGTELMFCNYATGGNLAGFPVYEKGPACSHCPHKTVCSQRYPGLCTMKPHDHAGTARPRARLFDDVIPVTWFVLIVFV